VSDTPRTDERTYPADCLGKTLVVNADWARELERENAALREMIDLAFRIPNMTDAELTELIRNCRAVVPKEQP
jgi:hypothetical protein